MRDNLIYPLVGHGGFVQGGTIYAGSVDTFHLLAVLLYAQTSESLLATHKAPCSMWSGAVPTGIALTDAKQAPIAHIDGNPQLLPRVSGSSTRT